MKSNTLITLLLSVFIALLGIGIIIPILPVFAEELGASGFLLGMIIAVFSITRGILMPVVGNLSDKWGRKRFLISGLLIYGIVGLLIPHARSIHHLIAIRSFHGVGSAMIVPIAMAYMSVLSPPGREGRYMSYLNIAIFSGIGCGPIIGGSIYDTFGTAAVFNLMAVMSFFASVLVVIYMPSHIETETPLKMGLLQSFMKMTHNRKTMGILLARYATMIIMVPTMAFLPLIMSQWQNSSGLQIGTVIACRTLINAVFQVPFGKLADRFNKLILLVTGCTVLSLIIISIPYIHTFKEMIFMYIFLGFVESSIWAVLGAYASIEAKGDYGHGTMMGVYSLAMSGGVFTGAVISGVSLDVWNIHTAYLVAGSSIAVLSLLGVILITLGKKEDTQL